MQSHAGQERDEFKSPSHTEMPVHVHSRAALEDAMFNCFCSKKLISMEATLCI